MADQGAHQEMGDEKGFWQVLLPLHESGKETTTTAIFPDGPEAKAVYPDLVPGDWVALRGDVWHAGSAVKEDAPTFFGSDPEHKLYPLVTFYYSTNPDDL